MAFGGKLDSNSFKRDKPPLSRLRPSPLRKLINLASLALELVTNFYPVLLAERGRFGASLVLTMQPCEQRFLTCMALSVYEVVRVACHSRSDKRLTDDANEFVNAKTHTKEKPLLAGYDDVE